MERLLAYLEHWQVAHLVSDCTGVGQGVTGWLRAQVGEGRVTAYDFSRPRAKAELGSAFLALVETNRFKYWSDEIHEEHEGHKGETLGDLCGSVPLSDSWWFLEQAAACAYEIPPEGTIDHDLRWAVQPAHRTQTPAGPVPTHDDRLVSAALVAELDRLLRAGELALGVARSAVISARDPLDRPVY